MIPLDFKNKMVAVFLLHNRRWGEICKKNGRIRGYVKGDGINWNNIWAHWHLIVQYPPILQHAVSLLLLWASVYFVIKPGELGNTSGTSPSPSPRDLPRMPCAAFSTGSGRVQYCSVSKIMFLLNNRLLIWRLQQLNLPSYWFLVYLSFDTSCLQNV